MASSAARMIVRAASCLVPAPSRETWRREQEGALWYREMLLTRSGKPDRALPLLLCGYALLSVNAAIAERAPVLRNVANSAWLPGAAMLALLLAAGLHTSGFAHTRRILFGPPLPHADKLALVVMGERTGFFGLRYGPLPNQLARWRSSNSSFADLAGYNMAQSRLTSGNVRFRHMLVTPNWFEVAGLQVPDEIFDRPNSILLSLRFANRHLDRSQPFAGQTINIDGRSMYVAGILPANFWFIHADIAAVSVIPPGWRVDRLVGLGRLRDGVSPEEAQNELRALQRREMPYVLALADRMRGPLRSEGLLTAMVLAFYATVTAVRVVRKRKERRFWLYHFAKVAGGLLAVLVLTFEYMASETLASTGVSLLERELGAFMFWLFAGAMVVLWAIRDQPGRCRHCLRRLELPTRVGSMGRVLFDHEATELVCPKGHGTLYVEPSTETWRQNGRWTELDDSWLELFEDAPPKR